MTAQKEMAPRVGGLARAKDENQHGYSSILDRLRNLPGKTGSETKFKCCCPAHEDRNPSLSVTVADNGTIGLTCFAGCEKPDIVAALDGTMADLFLPKDRPATKAKKTYSRSQCKFVCAYDYVDENGRLLYQNVRYLDPDGDKKFWPRRPDGADGWIGNLDGVERVLYRLSEVQRAKASGQTIYFCEGEKDADNVAKLGLCSTSIGSSSNSLTPSQIEILTGCDVVILEDNDRAGIAAAQRWNKSITGSVVVTFRDLPTGGDVSDWIAQGGTVEALQALVEEARANPDNEAEPEPEAGASLLPITFAMLAAAHPHLNPPVIDGLLRQGETMNVIAAPKCGKSWLIYDLALSITTGGRWLDYFQCAAGNVLLIDNELHAPTLAYRIPKVAEERRIPAGWQSRLEMLPIRGRGLTLDTLAPVIQKIKAGQYAVIILDAWYRFIPPGLSENDNAAVMSLYNTLDKYAASTGAAMVIVHHQSKGGQGDKAVTDVGAGAGAQSRAADTHLVLRQHEEDGCFVLDAAVRSFSPVDPLGLRWDFPVWRPAYNLDVEAVQGRRPRNETQRDEKDRAAFEAILGGLAGGPMSVREVRHVLGAGKERAERLLARLEKDGAVMWELSRINGGQGRVYSLTDPGTEPGTEPGTVV